MDSLRQEEVGELEDAVGDGLGLAALGQLRRNDLLVRAPDEDGPAGPGVPVGSSRRGLERAMDAGATHLRW